MNHFQYEHLGGKEDTVMHSVVITGHWLLPAKGQMLPPTTSIINMMDSLCVVYSTLSIPSIIENQLLITLKNLHRK